MGIYKQTEIPSLTTLLPRVDAPVGRDVISMEVECILRAGPAGQYVGS